MTAPLIKSMESSLRATHLLGLLRCSSRSLITILASYQSTNSSSISRVGNDIHNLAASGETCSESDPAVTVSSQHPENCRNTGQDHSISSLQVLSNSSSSRSSSRSLICHGLSAYPRSHVLAPQHLLCHIQSRQIASQQHGTFASAGLSTSALNAAASNSTELTDQTFPPGSEQWKQWVDALGTVPHIGPEGAREILIAAPQLLSGPTEGVSLRLSHLAELLAADAGVKDTDFAELLKSTPSLIINTTVDQAADALDWFKRTGHFGMRELNRAARHTPEVLSYSVEELRARLQSLLTLGLESAERACLCIIHTPRLLTFDPPTLVAKLDILVKEFGCSRRYIMQSAAHVLDRNSERLLVRAALLRHLGSGRVMIGDVYAAVSDAAFADVAVSAYQKRTEKTLLQVCVEFQQVPGMAEVMTQAGLPLDVATPLECFQAYHAHWKKSAK